MPSQLKSPHVVLFAGFMGTALAAGGIAFLALKSPVAGTAAPGTHVNLVELIGGQYPLARTAEALASPDIGAPSVIRVHQGSAVTVLGLVEGDKWYQIQLRDGRLAYVEVGAIPAIGATAAPAPTQPQTVPAANAVAPEATGAAQQPAPDGAAPAAIPQSQADADPPQVMTFNPAGEVRSLANPTAVYLKPNLYAPQAYPVDAGTQVYIIAKSADDVWAWVHTADNAPAYIPLKDIGP